MSRVLQWIPDIREGFYYVTNCVARMAKDSTRSDRLSVVVVPDQEVVIQLRKILAARGESFLNIHFWTPEQLRSRILRWHMRSPHFTQAVVASREELHLILSIVADTFSVNAVTETGRMLANAVKRNPAILLRVLDMLDAAGLDAGTFESLQEVVPLVMDFHATLEKQGLRTVYAMDRLLASDPSSIRFENLLIFGFHGGHWPLFPILTAACRLAQHAEVLLDAPRDVSFDLDSSWIGNWEEALKVSAVCLESQILAEVSAENEEPEKSESRQVEFLAEESVYTLAQAIALRAASFIRDGKESIAVVFSAYSALSREVAVALDELDIPYFDAIGHRHFEGGKNSAWRSWCAFQRNTTVQKFVQFIGLISENKNLADGLLKASREILSGDFRICREFARSYGGDEADQLSAYALLPERTSLAEFSHIVNKEFSRMGWWQQVARLQARRERFLQAESLSMTKDIFLRWLEAALHEESRRRSATGSHPYAAIHLVRRDQAALCSWTHVILAGMNAGEWPEPPLENGFFPADAIADFNRQIASTNEMAQVSGCFGEGHYTVAQIPCLGPQEHHLLQKRHFQALRQVSYLLATLQLKNNEKVSGRPSFWFSELFYESKGKSPSAKDLCSLISHKVQSKLSVNIKEVSSMRRTRLDATVPFGDWEFTSGFPAPALTVVDVERIVTEPSIVWLKTFLGVRSPENQSVLSWNATVGTWTHRWLRNLCCFHWNIISDQPTRRKAIADASEETRLAVERVCRAFQRPIPPWWTFLWEQAQSLAFQLSDQLEPFRPKFSFSATETSFQNVYVPPLGCFIRGRWDLVLCDQEIASEESQPFRGTSILVVDYKTGKAPNMASILRDGRGIQLALYSYAALAWGAQRVDSTWLAPHSAEEGIHLPFDALENTAAVLSMIGGILRRGVFGMRGALRSEFTFRSSMPLATLAVPSDILEAKWKLTHNCEM